MGLTALDMTVLIAVAGAAALGAARGFVSETLSLGAWLAAVLALKLFHAPLAGLLAGPVGTVSGAAVLAFAILGGGAYIAGRMIAGNIGKRTRRSVLGPVDRALGFGFGAVKGFLLASLGFLLIVLVLDTMGGGPRSRPGWITHSRAYPLLNATSASIADMIDRRRHGKPMLEGAAPRDPDERTS